jgi:cellulose synthase/poly-beta-1,6-N-acetylglucosamine synthase-like glycosyltransferase
MIKLSFIIPAYNEETVLGKCLESVLAEIKIYPEINSEIIVVNNASTDGTKDLALSFAGVKVVDEPKKGLVFARAAGAKAASGELLAHIDADCVLKKGWLKTVLQEFDRDENLAALSGPHTYYDLSIGKKFLVKIFYLLTYCFYFLNRYILRIGSLLQGGNFVVRARAWEKIGQAAQDFSFYGEDTDLCRRLYKVGKVKFTFKLPIYASGRRFEKEGLLTIGSRYALNYFSVLLFHKPATKNYKDIRPG